MLSGLGMGQSSQAKRKETALLIAPLGGWDRQGLANRELATSAVGCCCTVSIVGTPDDVVNTQTTCIAHGPRPAAVRGNNSRWQGWAERGCCEVWDPKVCVPKMAQPDFPDCKFRFFPRWSLRSGGSRGRGGTLAKKKNLSTGLPAGASAL